MFGTNETANARRQGLSQGFNSPHLQPPLLKRSAKTKPYR